ncbi:CocE/NonD family hydrolase C-terminal non-catalytic domain-containing protein [Ralstonia mannitolilytica]|uniref:CocE/NonD family hydrolase C-terminal non-catalytic domain-containing protein n=1 Tax=Ralstonia mannitolilytica TaxID=105219 RepID=UPI001F282BE9|nr:CocE/NonD family hydrolase C-terminal non-catalytic domain-containing protein [Ralstonia mannitolilytica]
MQMGNPRVRHGRMLMSALLCAALSLSGCGGGDGSAVANSTPANSNTTTQPTQPTQPAQPAAVNWTTRGTRATPVQPGTSIASNAGAKWDDYTPPARYAGVAKQATQYITMPDGTKLAAYVTLPADASGKAATGTFPEADVWISSTALDAGVSVRIDDVDAAGNVTPHTDGLQTASLRAVDASRSRTMNGLMIQPWHPFTTGSVQPIVPGQAVMVPVEVFRPAPSSPKATSCA